MMLSGTKNLITVQDHIVIVSLILGVIAVVALIGVVVARLGAKPKRD